jgi:RNA polymerase sigma-70 factor (ECF subfamily)
VTGASAAEIERVYREHHGRAVAALARTFGNLDLAEDAVADAFLTALEHWSTAGLPESPAGYLITTAKNRAVDWLRRDASLREKHARWNLSRGEEGDTVEPTAIPDDRLRLFFTCCHPALADDAKVALTLRLVGGLSTQEIARAFLVPEATMQQRLVRAKAKIRDARIPYRVPEGDELSLRLEAVLAVVYLVFNEGYEATSGSALSRDDLCREAIRLGRVVRELLPDEPEVLGLLALMLLVASRRDARTDSNGTLIPLPSQDRSLWDRRLIEEGQSLVRVCLERQKPGPYQIQAAIQAVHADARRATETDWGQVVALYDQLLILNPSQIVMLNRAVAIAELHGADVGLAIVEALPLDRYHLFHAVRAELYERVGRHHDAMRDYERAITLTGNEAERRFLRGKWARVKARMTLSRSLSVRVGGAGVGHGRAGGGIEHCGSSTRPQVCRVGRGARGESGGDQCRARAEIAETLPGHHGSAWIAAVHSHREHAHDGDLRRREQASIGSVIELDGNRTTRGALGKADRGGAIPVARDVAVVGCEGRQRRARNRPVLACVARHTEPHARYSGEGARLVGGTVRIFPASSRLAGPGGAVGREEPKFTQCAGRTIGVGSTTTHASSRLEQKGGLTEESGRTVCIAAAFASRVRGVLARDGCVAGSAHL